MALEQALDRRRALEADIALGQLELWIGVGANIAWPWLDVAVRIGKGWGVFVDHHAPMVQRPDFIAFVPALREFVERSRDDVFLGSLGGSMRITLRRSESGALYGEAWFHHGANTQTVSFSIWEDALHAALRGAEAALERVKSGRDHGWVPAPDRLDLLPHASASEAPPAPQRFEAWDSGLGDGEEVNLEYVYDAYGWYGVSVRVGEKQGEFGGSSLTDAMGDLLRAALALLAGAPRTELTCNAEPGLTRVEFERQALRTEVTESGLPKQSRYGCWIRIREIDDQTGAEREAEFEGLCRSPRAVAEAIYRMALPHFRDGAGPWSDAMAALEGALATVPRKPEDQTGTP